MLQAVPDWARGVFSIRFGGSEFKDANPSGVSALRVDVSARAPGEPATVSLNGHAPDTKSAECSARVRENGSVAKVGTQRLPTFTGSSGQVYGNSSRETGHTAQEHCASGLPVQAEDHPSGAVLWITGKSTGFS